MEQAELARLRDMVHEARAWPWPVQPAAPREWRPWLTLDEAAEYSGLPAHVITKLLCGVAPQLDCIGRGPKTWRIRRASLDAWGGGQ